MLQSPQFTRGLIAVAVAIAAAFVWSCMGVSADPPEGAPEAKPAETKPAETKPGDAPVSPDDKQLPGLKKLTKDYDVWIDVKRKIVVVDGKICQRKPPTLELFACPQGSKEHESIVALNTKAKWVHAALLAIGAQPGAPVKYDPRYVPANGPEIEILVLWKDAEGKPHKARAQDWIRNTKTGKEMTEKWVFGGSGFSVDEETGQEYYHAEGGELICLSNFPTATMDLPIESTAANEQLMFECITDRIPPVNTPVRLVLIPKFPEKKAAP